MTTYTAPGLTRATTALAQRWLWHLKGQLAGLIAALAQPALWLVLFGHLFANSNVVTGSTYISFMTAGVVVMTVFNGALNGGVELLFDRESGMLTRLLTTPIAPAAIILSRALYVVALTSVQGLIIIGAAAGFGVKISTGLGGIVLILVVGILFGVGVTALSMALAFGLRGHAQFFAITGFVGLPITFLSNALAPLQLMPGWLRDIARINPMTHAITAVRDLVLHGFNAASLAGTIGTLIVFDAVLIALAIVIMRRTTF
jgi:ABC-2 type transport system permease protein